MVISFQTIIIWVEFVGDGISSSAAYLEKCGCTIPKAVQIYVLPECAPSVGGRYFGHQAGVHYMIFPKRIIGREYSYVAHEMTHASHYANVVADCGDVTASVGQSLNDPVGTCEPPEERPANAYLLAGEIVALYGELRWIEHELGKGWTPFNTRRLIEERKFLSQRTWLQFVDPQTMKYADCYPAARAIGRSLRERHFQGERGGRVLGAYLDIDLPFYYDSDGREDSVRVEYLSRLLSDPSGIVLKGGSTIAETYPAGTIYRRRRKRSKPTN